MKNQAISAVFLFVALLSGGIAACTHSNASDPSSTTSSTDTAASSPQATTSENTQQSPQSAERSQRREAIRKQIEALLTPEQAKQLQTKLQSGEKMRTVLASLNLTAEQKTKIQDIYKANRAQHQATQEKS